jgi:hypothetical protein
MKGHFTIAKQIYNTGNIYVTTAKLAIFKTCSTEGVCSVNCKNLYITGVVAMTNVFTGLLVHSCNS